MVTQPLRPAGVGGATFQNGFHQRKFRRAIGQTCTRHDIANDIHIGLELHLVGGKTLYQINAQVTQLVAHRRVDASVATGNFVTSLAGQCG